MLLHSVLAIRALVEVATPRTGAWADVHVFDASDELIQAGTVLLHRRESTTNGTVFVWEDDVYQGSGGGSGIGMWSRPDAHTVQYRVYCQLQTLGSGVQGQMFTDGVLHEFDLPSDEDAARRAGDRGGGSP
jgi:hypothetical protein